MVSPLGCTQPAVTHLARTQRPSGSDTWELQRMGMRGTGQPYGHMQAHPAPASLAARALHGPKDHVAFITTSRPPGNVQ